MQALILKHCGEWFTVCLVVATICLSFIMLFGWRKKIEAFVSALDLDFYDFLSSFDRIDWLEVDLLHPPFGIRLVCTEGQECFLPASLQTLNWKPSYVNKRFDRSTKAQ